MAKLKHRRSLLIGLFTALAVSVFVIVFAPIDVYNAHVQKGNSVYYSEYATKDESVKMLAYKAYNQAQNDWPFLKYNFWFQKKYSETKDLIQEYKRTKPAVIAFLKDGFTEADINSLVNELKQNNNVKDVKYISKEDALKIYKESNKNDPVLIDLINTDILPASIEIFLFDWNEAKEIEDKLKGKSYISEVVSRNSTIAPLEN